MASPPLVALRDAFVTFGGRPVFQGISVGLGRGERVCLVGRNGGGKSTLLKALAGIVALDAGQRFCQPGARVAYMPQEPVFAPGQNAGDFIAQSLSEIADEAPRHRVEAALDEAGVAPDRVLAELSGGEARRTALARVLAPSPDILLLDEPTNHLDLPAIEWLESELSSMRSALVLISHDRRFLERLSRATVWLDRGRTRRLEQGFGAFEEWRDKVLEEEERDRHKLDRRIAMEEDWVRYGVTARRKRNQGRMARLRDLRRERREARRATGQVRMAASEAQASGALVIEAKRASKSFGELAVVKEFSSRVMRGDRIGIVGPNGSGKTTLLRLLTGTLAPDSGEVRLGSNVLMQSLDQRRATLSPELTLAAFLTDGRGDNVSVNGVSRHVSGYMKDFLFAPEQMRTPVSVLSGGERGRLMLAKAFAAPSNLLVLDEPTNDLDLETLDLLQELLADYSGTVLLVSHDRDFLDRVVTSVIMAEGDGRFVEYAGGYSDMVAQRGAGVALKAVQSKATAAPAAPKAARVDAPAARRKLSFKEKHALETLPAQITALEEEAGALRAQLADDSLYARDAKKFADLAAKLAAAQAKLSAAEEQWLELEMLRQEIEG